MIKKKVAIIGAGQVAEKVHVSYYLSRNEVELVAIVSRDIDRAKEFAEKHGIPHYYSDAVQMYTTEIPDIVSVCTPNQFHYESVMQALEFGCDVLCEKPPAITAQEAWEMKEAAKKNNCLLAYDFQHRFADDVRIIKEKADENVLGDIYVVKVKALRRCGIPGWGSFTNKKLQGGGPLIDLGVHMLDAALYILGYPKIKKVTAKMYQKIGRVKSQGTLGEWDPEKFEVEDSLFGFIELENGCLVQLETSFALNIKETSIMNVEFYGDKAGATLFPAQIYTDENGELITLLEIETADTERHKKSMTAFVNKCLGEEIMVANGAQGYVIQQLVEILYQSAEKGESIAYEEKTNHL